MFSYQVNIGTKKANKYKSQHYFKIHYFVKLLDFVAIICFIRNNKYCKLIDGISTGSNKINYLKNVET